MHDKNGKSLKVGDDIVTYMHGLMTITNIGTQSDGSEYLTASTCEGALCGYDQSVCTVEVQKVRTWKELAQEALDVQNASNLSGVSKSFAEVVREVRTRLEVESKGGNRELHSHPIIQLWADKIASLTNTQNNVSWTTSAYDAVHKMAES